MGNLVIITALGLDVGGVEPFPVPNAERIILAALRPIGLVLAVLLEELRCVQLELISAEPLDVLVELDLLLFVQLLELWCRPSAEAAVQLSTLAEALQAPELLGCLGTALD